MTRILLSALGAAVLLLSPITAFAQGTQPPAQSAAPAASDEAKAPTARGGTPGKRGGGRLAACRSDAATYCADAAKGGRRQCLRDNAAKLSSECQAALANVGGGKRAAGKEQADEKGKVNRKERRQARREACRGDVQTVCAGVERGGGAIGKCLRENVAKLSPTCAATIQSRQSKTKG